MERWREKRKASNVVEGGAFSLRVSSAVQSVDS